MLELIHSHLDVGKGMKASEERGACFGKGFALLALVCSGTLKRTVCVVISSNDCSNYIMIINFRRTW